MIYTNLFRCKWICCDAKSIDDFIKTFEELAKMFIAWKAKGIKLNPESNISDDYAMFYTEDAEIAEQEDFEPPFEDGYEEVKLCE